MDFENNASSSCFGSANFGNERELSEEGWPGEASNGTRWEHTLPVAEHNGGIIMIHGGIFSRRLCGFNVNVCHLLTLCATFWNPVSHSIPLCLASAIAPLERGPAGFLVDGEGEWQLNSFVRTLLTLLATIFPVLCGGSLLAQTIALPPRPANALDGDAFAQKIKSLDLAARDREIADQFLAGNVPDFLRKFCPVTVTNVSDDTTNVATLFVAPDYLAIGSDTDYFFAPISPDTAQDIADKLNCTLPTRAMVNAIYAASAVKLAPRPIPPSGAMTTAPIFAQNNKTVWAQRMALTNLFPLGVLVDGDKKDLVISRRLAVATNNVAIYGWHQTNGVPIQPLYLGHAWWWVDYSQGVRLVSRTMIVNGKEKSVDDVLADPKLCGLISDEGMVTNARYRTQFSWPDKITLPWPDRFSADIGHSTADFPPALRAGTAQRAFPTSEWIREIKTLDGVRILIDAPAPESFSADKPVELIFYALPNGNTIEETIGKKLAPGDDWHFDIQHIGAQTRWLRQAVTNTTIVVAYLEADTKSWPAWRKTHPDRRIVEILDEVSGIFASNRTYLVLASHSGGGSLVFGYLNAIDEIPANIRRIAFLDSDYGYDSWLHAEKIMSWLAASDENRLCILAYQDYLGIYKGKPFVSAAGGTWGRSWAMLWDFSRSREGAKEQPRREGRKSESRFRAASESAAKFRGPSTQGVVLADSHLALGYYQPPFQGFQFVSETNSGLEIYSTTNRQIEFLLKENPDHKILHTIQVERNGFIQAILSATKLEGRGYEYLGERAYTNWVR